MLRLLLAAAASLAVVSPASASAMQAHAPQAERATDERAQRFLTLLQAGKASQAIDEVMSSSPLYAHKAGTKEAILGQIDAALGAYGPVTSFEKISTDTLGTMVVRQYYFVQHRDMVVRWEFQLIRTGSGWRVGYFGFEDKVPNWFE